MQITFSYGWGVRSDALTPALSHREREKGGGPLLAPPQGGRRAVIHSWFPAGREKGGGPLLAPPQGGRRAVIHSWFPAGREKGGGPLLAPPQGGRRAVIHSWFPAGREKGGGPLLAPPQGGRRAVTTPGSPREGEKGVQRKETTLFASVPFLSGIHLVQIASRFRRRMAGGQGGVDIPWRHGVNDIRCLHLIA